MKCSRFSKILRGEDKNCFRRHCFENKSGAIEDSSPEQDHSENSHEMDNKNGSLNRHGMHHHCRKHHRFGHGHLKSHRHHGAEHGFMKDYRMRHGHHKMSHGLHVHHGMEHGHPMHHRMKHIFGKLHRRHGHMKFHKMARLFRHEKMCHGMRHKLDHWKMQHDDASEHQKEKKMRQFYPGKAQEESGNVSSCSKDSSTTTGGEIRTYPSKCDVQVRNENNTFQISMNTSSYQPEEICVKIADGKIDVSAIHESVDDDLYEFHEMYRSFKLPENVNPENVLSRLESDGRLIIEAPINSTENSNERYVPVVMENEE